MSRFYADITGGKGTARREGHAATGIRTHVRGRRSGVLVIGVVEDGDDVFHVVVTSGMDTDLVPNVLVGDVVLNGYDEPLFVPRR
jgi:hypothetical protein